MAAISFLSFNVAVGCIMGSYGVLIPAIEEKLGVSRDLSSLGIPAVMVAGSLFSPVFGVLVTKFSIRLLMLISALMMSAGFVLLALANNVYLLLTSYFVLIGPSFAMNVMIAPTILVSRWFVQGRGRALGIVNMPILAIVMPPAVSLALEGYGLSTTYLILAGLAGLLVLATLFVVDRPAAAAEQTGEVQPAHVGDPGFRVAELLRSGRFWALSLAFAALMTAASVLSAHIVPLAIGWGVDATSAAALLSFSSIGSMIGAAVLSWAAERLGGVRALAILCLMSAIWWFLLLAQPGYAGLVFITTLLGFTGGPIVPIASLALAQLFGEASLGRALGLCNLLNLPYVVLALPLAAHVYVRTGSYAGAIIGVVLFSLLGLAMAATLAGQVSRRPSR